MSVGEIGFTVFRDFIQCTNGRNYNFLKVEGQWLEEYASLLEIVFKVVKVFIQCAVGENP